VARGDSLKHLLQTSRSGFPSALRAVARDSITFKQLWSVAVRGDPGPLPTPRIDFEREMVIVAAMGSMASTGFGVVIESVVVRGPSVEVHARLGSAGSLCIQGAAMTNPVDIVVVPASSGVVVFRDRHLTSECKMPWSATFQTRGPAVTGTVVDSTGVHPVHQARVDLLGSTTFALGDSAGRFVLSPVPEGRQILRVRGIGFLPREISIVTKGDTLRLGGIRLRPSHRLDSLNVIAPD
jgi:hypothetical protein